MHNKTIAQKTIAQKTIIIIGAGAAGSMAAIFAKRHNPLARVIVIESNEKVGKKLYITGKGRCNLTNAGSIQNHLNNIVTNPKFLYSALNNFSALDTIAFFENELGVPLKTERGNRVFPVSDKSSDIIKALDSKLKELGVELHFAKAVKQIELVDSIATEKVDCQKVGCEKASCKQFKIDNIIADKLIIATGGKSYSATGSTGDGFKFAESFGHTIIEPKAALVPIILKDTFVKGLEGLTLKNVELVCVQAQVDKTASKTIFKQRGEVLFTNEGISGPLALTLSSHINKLDLSTLVLSIDLKPALSLGELDTRLLSDFAKFNNKQFKNALYHLLPKSIVLCVVELSEIDPNKQINAVTKAERQALANLLKNFPLNVKALYKLERAVVTSGGVCVKEVCPKTMQSKLVKGLYFAGEVLDVDALTGGYNLQIAFSTGVSAGVNATH
ncbi:MAG: NAD(P)/FAD-dependent oxidoreductase [Firmicutes bacterium]|nr:NAD(P)/FAD-dependent oxidoreductase [Bacillota bacterium]